MAREAICTGLTELITGGVAQNKSDKRNKALKNQPGVGFNFRSSLKQYDYDDSQVGPENGKPK